MLTRCKNDSQFTSPIPWWSCDIWNRSLFAQDIPCCFLTSLLYRHNWLTLGLEAGWSSALLVFSTTVWHRQETLWIASYTWSRPLSALTSRVLFRDTSTNMSISCQARCCIFFGLSTSMPWTDHHSWFGTTTRNHGSIGRMSSCWRSRQL